MYFFIYLFVLIYIWNFYCIYMIYEDKIYIYVIKLMIIRCISMFYLLGFFVDVGDRN